jgi:hypothetical protein
MLRIQRMNANGVAKLGEAIGQRSNRRNLRRLHTCVKEAPHTGITPALSNLLQVFVEISKDDVAVAVNQRSRKALESDGSCHGSKVHLDPT